MKKKIGIFGGTFDPIHMGHLITATHVREQVGLNWIYFVPTYKPPHKKKIVASFDHRCQMVGIASVNDPYILCNPIEAQLTTPSYFVNTMQYLNRNNSKDFEFYIIMGEDCAADLPKWYKAEEWIKNYKFIFTCRDSDPDAHTFTNNEAFRSFKWKIKHKAIETPRIDISSTEIRKRISKGKSIKYLVPELVEKYIQEQKLYLNK